MPPDLRAEEFNPLTNKKAVVTAENVRFTVLMPQLIRMEWAEDGKFIDQASLTFINRNLPVPEYRVNRRENCLIIETEKLALKYQTGSGKFHKENLSIEFRLNGNKKVWYPGLENKGNLKGTTCTLDNVKGATELEPGLLSRDGWSLVDDSKKPLFDDCDWQWAIPAPERDYQDWYFFGYGHDYKQALYDFTQIAGKIPLPPRFAFGLWWSKYWAYTDQDLKQLVQEFEIHHVPLDVLVIDMDWHQTFNLRWKQKRKDQAGYRLGWTGYTWDRILFPDPEEFLSWCHQKGLKMPLNLHPASGIQPHEERYPEMARAMGIDPDTQKYIPFDITDKKFAKNYLEIIHHPLEEQGVDFWWLDWQQHKETNIPGVNPTFWLNYVHFTDMERQGKRPLIFHRWGGLGNHRYQIGFSGDAISVWESLAFQPYFTATASNVGYGYWSHDIGGHIPGEVSAELYTRWIQFGVFSPVLRTHTTRNHKAERRIWAYPTDYFIIMRDAILLRYALIPYIYTAARKAFDTGVSICRPMYYDYPEHDEAYDFKDQYMFGDDLLIAPVTHPINADNLLAEKEIWLPEGTWIEWFTRTMISGNQTVQRQFAIDEIPVYVKAGAIIPMQPKVNNTEAETVDPLILTIFSGEKGETHLYEDEGSSLDYKTDQFTITKIIHHRLNESQIKIDIFPVEGTFPTMLFERSYEIRLPLSFPPEQVLCNGKKIDFNRDQKGICWWYEGDQLTTIIKLPHFSTDQRVEVVVKIPEICVGKNALLQSVPGMLKKFKRVMTLLNSLWSREWSPDIIIKAAQTGNRIRLNPGRIIEELEIMSQDIREIEKSIKNLEKVNKEIVSKVLAHIAAGMC